MTSPAPPISVIATSRWYLACTAAPTAQTMPMTHSSTNAGDAGSRARSPHDERNATRRDEREQERDRDDREHLRLQAPRADDAKRARAASASSPTSALSNRRLPLRRSSSGGCSKRPRTCCLRSQQIASDAAEMATRLMTKGSVEAVPHGEAVLGERPADHGPGRGCERGADGDRRCDADDEAREDQQLDRRAHPPRRLFRLARQVGRRWTEEDVVAEAKRVHDARRSPAIVAAPGAPTSIQGWDERNTVSAKNISFERKPFSRGTPAIAALATSASVPVMRHGAHQPIQAPDVARARLVVDDARGHEQRGLERGVVHDVEHAGDRRERAVEPEQERDEAEMADGRVGEHALQIVLEHRDVRAEQRASSRPRR